MSAGALATRAGVLAADEVRAGRHLEVRSAVEELRSAVVEVRSRVRGGGRSGGFGRMRSASRTARTQRPAPGPCAEVEPARRGSTVRRTTSAREHYLAEAALLAAQLAKAVPRRLRAEVGRVGRDRIFDGPISVGRSDLGARRAAAAGAGLAVCAWLPRRLPAPASVAAWRAPRRQPGRRVPGGGSCRSRSDLGTGSGYAAAPAVPRAERRRCGCRRDGPVPSSSPATGAGRGAVRGGRFRA
jgi:hypothetical protein